VRYATMNLGLGIGSVAGAMIADVSAPASLRALFLIQAATMLTFAAIVGRLQAPRPAVPALLATRADSYRKVMADRPFRRLLGLVTLLVGAGYAQYQVGFPAFATEAGGMPASVLGVAFAANTFTIVVAQLPMLRLMSRWRRSRGLALVGALWAAAWSVALLAATERGGTAAVVGFAAAMVLFGLGETALSPTLGPLVNDLASDAGRGRYNGACAMASTTGFTLGPAIIGILLGAGLAHVALILLIGACVVVIVGARRLERSLPAVANVVAHVPTEPGILAPAAV
jgi:MFS family permease